MREAAHELSCIQLRRSVSDRFIKWRYCAALARIPGFCTTASNLLQYVEEIATCRDSREGVMKHVGFVRYLGMIVACWRRRYETRRVCTVSRYNCGLLVDRRSCPADRYWDRTRVRLGRWR
jgi:hypothetical protein